MMNNDLQKLLLLLIPAGLILIIGTQLRLLQGPAFAFGNHDPEYAYLMNAQLVRHWQTPQHRDHPGTSVQSLGALATNLLYLGRSPEQIDRAVLGEPEDAITQLSFSLRLLGLLIQVAAALIIALHFQCVYSALIYFLTPYAGVTTWMYIYRYSPDFFLLSLAQLFCSLIFVRAESRRALAMGAAYGAILATKITGAPIALLALVALPNWRKSLVKFSIATLVAGVFCSLPLFLDWRSSAHYVLVRVPQIIFFRSNHGKPLPPLELLLASAKLFVSSCLPLLAIACGVYLLFRLRRSRAASSQISIAAIATGIVLLQIVISATDGAPRYLLPSFACASLLLLFTSSLIGKSKKALVSLGVGLLALLSLASVWSDLNNAGHQKLFASSDSSRAQAEQIHDCLTVYQTPTESLSENKYASLDWGNNFAGRYFAQVLNEMYPEVFFYSLREDRWKRFGDSPLAPHDFDRLRSQPLCFSSYAPQEKLGEPLVRSKTDSYLYRLR